MTLEPEESVLARELGKLGGVGARLVARLMPTNVGEAFLTVSLSEAVVRTIVLDLLASDTLPPSTVSNEQPIRAVIGSGQDSLNPALVTVTVEALSDQQTRLVVRGAAKEGLIKQRGGEQAASLVMSRLSSALRQAMSGK